MLITESPRHRPRRRERARYTGNQGRVPDQGQVPHGRPWHYNDDNLPTSGGGASGCIDLERAVETFVGTLEYTERQHQHRGHVRTHLVPKYRNSPAEYRALAIGSRRQHDDAEFAEVNRSMAAHYENSSPIDTAATHIASLYEDYEKGAWRR